MLMPLALLLVIIFLASFILTMVGLWGGGLTFPPFCPVEIACHHCRVSIPFPQWYCRHFRSHYLLSTLRRTM